jgi:NADH:ubiquinone oxidoreductase subunit 5 (subunit L)/multisubunit Na+/H+ antiporter MnhA subunit
MLWLYSATGTLLFYDGGNGCLEQSALARLVAQSTWIGMGVSTAIALLIFCGAMGKSGQVPLHVWLPDAMEGPTPVSALIHAATMVAAGVFLVARVYPLMEAVPAPRSNLQSAISNSQFSIPRTPPSPLAQESEKAAAPGESSKPVEPATAQAAKSAGGGEAGSNQITQAQANIPPLLGRGQEASEGSNNLVTVSTALRAVTWIGSITALFAALIAVAQTDIKRILAYSTVSQLGFMFMGLGVGGVAVGMFHLLTHAFFKALLFLGAGSVIHGCHEEQDIRRMGGLRKLMPVTFVTYAVGMMALSGVPLFFSGFWSKDEILHAAALWSPSKWPFLIGIFGAFLTAFYMTRQMWYVFFAPRGSQGNEAQFEIRDPKSEIREKSEIADAVSHDDHAPHESPPVMITALAVLAVCAVLLSVLGTPVWPWFHSYLSGHATHFTTSVSVGTLLVMMLSAVVVLGGISLSWWFYSRHAPKTAWQSDPLEQLQPDAFAVLRGKFFIDELYQISVIRWNAWCARTSNWLDDTLWDGMVKAVSFLVLGLSWLSRLIDEFVVNPSFDQGCGGLRSSSRMLALWQNGQVQRYLRLLALALTLFGVIFIWGCRG